MSVSRREFIEASVAGIAGLAVGFGAGWVAKPPVVKEIKPEKRKPPTELKLAYIAFQSGPAAAFGVPGHNAIDLLVDKVNSEGGILGVPVKVIHEDEGSPDQVVEKFRRLATENKVDVIMGLCSTATTLAAGLIAEKYQTIFINTEARTYKATWKDPSDPSKGKLNWVFKSDNSSASQAISAAYLAKNFYADAKKIAQVHPDYEHGYEHRDVFSAAVKKLMPDVELLEPLFPKLFTSDYTPYISKVIDQKPDLIYTSLWGSDATRFTDQLAPYKILKGTGGNVGLIHWFDFYLSEKRPIPDWVFGNHAQTTIEISAPGYALNKPPGGIPTFTEDFKSKYGYAPTAGAMDALTGFYAWKNAVELAYELKGEFPTNNDVRMALERLSFAPLNSEYGSFRSEDHRCLWTIRSGMMYKDYKYYPYGFYPHINLDGYLIEPPPFTDPVPWINTWKI